MKEKSSAAKVAGAKTSGNGAPEWPFPRHPLQYDPILSPPPLSGVERPQRPATRTFAAMMTEVGDATW